MSDVELFTYKCRAECPHDAKKLEKRCKARLDHLKDFSIVVNPEYGEAEVTFSCAVPEYLIHRVLKVNRMKDCHVMHETLTLSSQYTGVRNYSMLKMK